MNNKHIGLLTGLLLTISLVYAFEAYEEITEDDDYIKGGFFIILVASHVVIAYMIYAKLKRIHYLIIGFGTAALVVLYVMTHLDPQTIGTMGMMSKIIQIPIMALSFYIYKSINQGQK